MEIGGFHVSGLLSMIPEMPADLQEAVDLGCSLFAGEAEGGRFDDILRAAIGLGGTITGEHGVGRTKKAALPEQLGPDVMALTRRVKDALDPAGILNPGAVM